MLDLQLQLIVVVAGLAILSSLSIPNILSRIKLNRVEEAKALMNSYALDCLAKYRISTKSISDFLKDEKPEELDNDKLKTLQYQIDGDKNKCANVAIKPLDDNEKELFARQMLRNFYPPNFCMNSRIFYYHWG